MRKATSAVRVLNSRGSTLLDLISIVFLLDNPSSGVFLAHDELNTTQLSPSR